MSGKSINFDNKNIKKSDFYKNKKLLKIEDIDINKIFVSKKESYGAKNAIKYFIGYIYLFIYLFNEYLDRINTSVTIVTAISVCPV